MKQLAITFLLLFAAINLSVAQTADETRNDV